MYYLINNIDINKRFMFQLRTPYDKIIFRNNNDLLKIEKHLKDMMVMSSNDITF
jgi:hypothetical protein